MNGIPSTIIQRANEIATLSARGENLVAACAKMSAEETDALEEAVCINTSSGVKNDQPIQKLFMDDANISLYIYIQETIARNFIQLSFEKEGGRFTGDASARDLLNTLLEGAPANCRTRSEA